jgi:AraC-like DNA-binding protein
VSTAFLNHPSSVLCGAHPHQVSDYVNRHVGAHGLRLASAVPARSSLYHRKAGEIDLCRLNYGTRVRVVSDCLGDIYHLQFILRGHCRYEQGRDSLDVAPGHLLLINPHEPIDLTYSDDCEKFIVRVPETLFAAACAENDWRKPGERIRFNHAPYRFEDVQSLMLLLRLICEEVESGQTTPQILGHYNRVVVNKLMAMLPSNLVRQPHDAQAARFARIKAYIDANIKSELDVAALARQANLGQRALYALFESQVQMTPLQFVRARKLERVHRALTDPACPLANVTAVALEYGFAHLGRFSDLYRATYGVLPSQALKRRALS